MHCLWLARQRINVSSAKIRQRTHAGPPHHQRTPEIDVNTIFWESVGMHCHLTLCTGYPFLLNRDWLTDVPVIHFFDKTKSSDLSPSSFKEVQVKPLAIRLVPVVELLRLYLFYLWRVSILSCWPRLFVNGWHLYHRQVGGSVSSAYVTWSRFASVPWWSAIGIPSG